MLPDTDYRPARGLQSLVGIEITLAIGLDLFTPEPSITLRPRAMFRTPMPETPIYENGNTSLGKRQICTPSWFEQNRVIDSIPETHCMQPPPQFHFWWSISLPRRGHALAGRFRRRNRSVSPVATSGFVRGTSHRSQYRRERRLPLRRRDEDDRRPYSSRWDMMLFAMALPNSTGTAFPMRRPMELKFTGSPGGMNL